MVHVLVEHDVEDFKRWKTAFDEHAETRADAGSLGGHLLHGADDPSEVVVLFEWSSREEAEAFVASDDLAETMRSAGVVGTPEVTFLQSIETFVV